jgi:flagellar biogenesis protein FliO
MTLIINIFFTFLFLLQRVLARQASLNKRQSTCSSISEEPVTANNSKSTSHNEKSASHTETAV